MRDMKPFGRKFACILMPRFEFGILKHNENLRTSIWKTRNYVGTKYRTHRCI